MNRFYRRTVLIQILADYVSIIVSFVLGYIFWKTLRPEVPFHLLVYFKLAIVFGFVYIFIYWLTRLYEEELSILNVEQLSRIIKGWIIGSGLLFSIGFLSKELSFSRLTFIFTVVILFFVMIFQRSCFFGLWQRFHRKGIGVYRAVIIGVDDTSINVFNILVNSPWLGIVPVGFIDNEKDEVVGKDSRIYSTLGKIDELEKIINLHKIEQAIITHAKFTGEELHRILRICGQFKLHTRVVPHFYNSSIQRIQMENLMGIPLLGVNTPRFGWLYPKVKRALDIVISMAVLICLSPLVLIIALFLKRDSTGPVLFSQERAGKDGKLFKMYKFRSMYVDANKYEKCPSSLNDSRITRMGRFLRRASLDELPQFINVLKGDMSIIGPRPEMPFIVEKYNDLQKNRLKARPGITGLWQISHQRGSPIHENIDYDFYYIENQSFTMDLAIILFTLFSLLKGIGAY